MKYRINYKRLLVLTLLVCIFVLVLRGCAASCRTGEVTLPEDSEEEYLLSHGEKADPLKVAV